jgi:hypothetical protein
MCPQRWSTGVLLDVLTDNERWFDWSSEALARGAAARPLVINPSVYAEISIRFMRIEGLDATFGADFERRPLPWAAAFLAGKPRLLHRRSRGGRRAEAAHAGPGPLPQVRPQPSALWRAFGVTLERAHGRRARRRSSSRKREVGMFVRAMSVALLLAGPAAGAVELGVAGGTSLVVENGPDARTVRPHVQARLSWRVGGRWRMGIEAGRFGLLDAEPRRSDFGARGFQRIPETVGVGALMLSLQYGRERGLYLRPSLGLARHAFPVYLVPGPANEVLDAGVSHEVGPALGLTVGKELKRLGATRLALEGIGLLSAGEDSSSPRTTVGLQLAAIWGR